MGRERAEDSPQRVGHTEMAYDWFGMVVLSFQDLRKLPVACLVGEK